MHVTNRQWMLGALLAAALTMPAFAQAPDPASPAKPLTLNDIQNLPADQMVLPPAAAAPEATTTKPLNNFLHGLTNKTATENTVSENAASEGPKTYSYGTSNTSILFLPTQMERMKAAIRAFEDTTHETVPNFVAPLAPTAPLPEVKIEEPATYPVFYLASIAYDTPKDWSIWVSGHKITSSRNPTDLTVESVTPDHVTFSWKPNYASAIERRRNTKLFAATGDVKNKMAHEQNLQQDAKTKAITFTLRQNQSYVSGYDKIFEGYVDSPKLSVMTPASLTPVVSESIPPMPGSGPGEAADAITTPQPPPPPPMNP